MRESDFCRFVFKDKSRLDFMCHELMIIEWPPPEFLTIVGRNFQRVSYSFLSSFEAEAKGCARGALYMHMPDVKIGVNDAKPS